MRRRSRKVLEKTLVGLFVVLVVTAGYYVYLQIDDETVEEAADHVRKVQQPVVTETLTSDPLSLREYLQVDISVSPGKLILAKNCTAIVLTTTVQKTFSIERGIEKKFEVRPNEHDLLADVLENYEITPLQVKLHAFTKDIYYAQLVLRQNGHVLSLDSKPSDALAIAARFHTPVYIKRDLIEKLGEKVC